MRHSLRAAVLLVVFLLGLFPSGLVAASSHQEFGSMFPDVPAHHPDRAYIQYLAGRKLINGYPDGRFGPADSLNRAAAAKLATQVAGLAPRPSGQALGFTDLAEGHWSIPFVRAGVAGALLRGFDDSTFRPDGSLTRAQLAALAIRATRQATGRLPSITLNDVGPNDWFYREALLAVAADMLEADGGNFRPNDIASRAEAARAFAQAMLYTPLAFDTPLAVLVTPDRGQVELRQPGEPAFTRITRSTALQEGGRVRTAGASAAVVDFPDGSSLYLDNLSELVLHTSRGTELVGATGVEELDVELVRGKLLFSLTPRLPAEEAQALRPVLTAFLESEGSAAVRMAPRADDGSAQPGPNLPPDATRLLLWASPASLEPGDKEGAELTVVLANEAGEPVTASQGPVSLKLLSDVGTLSNASPEIPQGMQAVTVKFFAPDEEPEDAKTRVTAVAGEVSSSLTVPTSKTRWWQALFAKKTRAKVRMPWSVAAVRGTTGKAEVTATGNSLDLLNGDATLTGNNGDTTDVTTNQTTGTGGPDESPGNAQSLDLDKQKDFGANRNWISNTTRNQLANATDENRKAVEAAKEVVENLVDKLPRDTVKPTVSIGSPGEGQRFGTGQITLSGSASDNVKLASVTVNGSAATLDAYGNWSAGVTLRPGANTLTAAAADGAGNSSSASVTVNFDAAHPAVSLSGPEFTREKTLTLAGSVSAPGGLASLTVNGAALQPDQSGAFTATAQLQPGTNVIQAVAVDKQGRTVTAELAITSAPELPLLSLDAGEAVVGRPQYTVSGRAVAQYAKLQSVTVNGASILFTDDGSFAAPVKLNLGENTIQVSATDAAGNQTTASRVVTLDAAAPSVLITQPRDGLITREASIRVHVAATALLGIKSLTLNGRPITPDSDGSARTDVALQEGENVLTAALEGESGRKAADTSTVYRLTKPPMLMLTQPENGQKAARRQITVAGTAAAAFGQLKGVTVAGQSMPLSPGGGFATEIQLENGENRISVSAADAAGNVTTETRTVLFDPQRATLNLTSPRDGLITRESSVTVSGTLDKGDDVKAVTIDGVSVPVTGGRFSAKVALAPGTNALSIALPAHAGGAIETRTVIFADKPPTLTLDTPAEGVVTAKPELSVAGTALTSYGTAPSVSVNGQVIPVSASGSFSRLLTLRPGKTTVSVSATDDAGNTASTTRTVEYKPALPLISITAPANGTTTKESAMVVQGKVTSPVGVESVTVGGSSAPVDRDGNFSASVALKPGENTITVTATDKAGGTATESRTVIRGGVPPQLSIDSPAEAFVTGKPALTVSGSAKAVAGKVLSVTVGGSGASVSPDGSWVAQVKLAPGENRVTVVAMDTLGGTATASRQVTLAEGPTVTLTSPADGTITPEGKIAVRGRVKASTATYRLTVNGAAVTPGPDGSFETTVELMPGPNTIAASVTDALDGSVSASATVTRAEKLAISLSAKAVQDTVFLTGSVSGALGDVTVTVNGQAVSVTATGAFSLELPLEKGSYTFTAAATDSAGRTATASASPFQVPVITSPSSGTYDYDTTVVLQGKAEPGAALEIRDGTVVVQTTSAHPSTGAFSVTVDRLNDGLHSFSVRDTARDLISEPVTVTIFTQL